MARLCPVCTSSNTLAVFIGRSGREEYSKCGCRACDTIWQERHDPGTGETEQSEIELYAPTREAVMAKWQARLKAEEEADFSPHGEKSSLPISHSHDAGDGCPLCGSVHIELRVQGPGRAACSCIACRATWNHRYDAYEERVYRTNVKRAEG